MADMAVSKALSVLRGRLREHLLGPLAQLEQVLEAAARAEAEEGSSRERRAVMESQLEAARGALATFEAAAEKRRAEIGTATTREYEETLKRVRGEVQSAIASLEDDRVKAARRREEAEAERIGAERDLAAAKRLAGAWREEWDLQRLEMEQALAAQREAHEATGAALRAEIARLRDEHREIVNRIEALLPGRR